MAAKVITPKEPCCGKCAYWNCYAKQVDYDGITWGECWRFDTVTTADEGGECERFCDPGHYDDYKAIRVIEN